MVGRVLGVVVPVVFLDDVAIAYDHKTADWGIGVLDELNHLVQDCGVHALFFWWGHHPCFVREVGDCAGRAGITIDFRWTDRGENKKDYKGEQPRDSRPHITD